MDDVLFDLSPIIDLCGEGFTVTRRDNTGMYIDGQYYKECKEKQFMGNGSFQPVSPEELMKLPELGRSDDTHWLYTDCLLFVGGAKGSANDEEPDRVCRHNTGLVYEPKAEENWHHQGNFYKYLLVRVGQ